MSDLNKVTLIGNLVHAPEARRVRRQRVTAFTLVTNYAWQDPRTKAMHQAIDFHEVIAWGKLGGIVRGYVREGCKLYVEGWLWKRTAVGKDGARRTTTENVADNIIMFGHRSTGADAPVERRLECPPFLRPRIMAGYLRSRRILHAQEAGRGHPQRDQRKKMVSAQATP